MHVKQLQPVRGVCLLRKCPSLVMLKTLAFMTDLMPTCYTFYFAKAITDSEKEVNVPVVSTMYAGIQSKQCIKNFAR